VNVLALVGSAGQNLRPRESATPEHSLVGCGCCEDVNGGVNMPAFGKSLSPEDLAQITAFLQSRKHPMPAELQASEH
jgi:mono/diheme cytochrome c family protein